MIYERVAECKDATGMGISDNVTHETQSTTVL